MSKIGFIGLGNMGGPMVSNLIKAGHDVKAFDLVPEALDRAVEEGAERAGSAEQTVDGVEVLISMLPASQHVEGLYMGPDGLLQSIDSKTLVIDCSTIAPDTSEAVAEAATQAGIEILDAPVSGGVGGAVAGTLTFIVGGSSQGVEQARPIFEDMGKKVFHAGGPGSGQIAKFCNNMLLSVLMTGTAEVLQLGVDNGLDPAVLSEIMRNSSGGNWALEVYNPWPGVMDGVPASREYDGGFLVDLMIKDLGLAMDAAREKGSSTPMGALARNLYVLHRENGYGRKDFSSIQQFFKHRT